MKILILSSQVLRDYLMIKIDLAIPFLIFILSFSFLLGCTKPGQFSSNIETLTSTSSSLKLGTIVASLTTPNHLECSLFEARTPESESGIFSVDVEQSQSRNYQYSFLQQLPIDTYRLEGILHCDTPEGPQILKSLITEFEVLEDEVKSIEFRFFKLESHNLHPVDLLFCADLALQSMKPISPACVGDQLKIEYTVNWHRAECGSVSLDIELDYLQETGPHVHFGYDSISIQKKLNQKIRNAELVISILSEDGYKLEIDRRPYEVIPCEDDNEDVDDHSDRSSPSIPLCNHPIFPITAETFISRGSEGYNPPTLQAQEAFSNMLTSLLNEEYIPALDQSEAAGYRICQGVDQEQNLLYIKPISLDGSALMVLRIGESSPLIIGSPHPLYDSTLSAGNHIFKATSAKAYILSQTHRCANSAPSGCDGYTRSCGEYRPYTESDMAHTQLSFFQDAHRILAHQYNRHLFINLHGMRRTGVSLSNGTRNEVDIDSPVARLAMALSMYFPEEYITTCNAYEGATVENHLCGTTNVQGRFLNSSVDSCTEAAISASNRFIHLEQSSAIKARPFEVASAIIDALSHFE